MTNKNISLTVVFVLAVLIVGVSGWYFMDPKSDEKKSEMPDIIKNDVTDNSMSDKKVEPVAEKVEVKMEVPETANAYKISSGEASYTVVKTYFGKPGEEVTGTSEVVKGDGWLDEENGKGYINVMLNFTDFKTASSKRDSDIAPLFADKNITLVGEINGLDTMKAGSEMTLKIPLMLTINGVKKDTLFDIKVTIDKEGMIKANGEANIDMGDFSVNAPSLINVFSVANEVKLMFDVKGEKLSK